MIIKTVGKHIYANKKGYSIQCFGNAWLREIIKRTFLKTKILENGFENLFCHCKNTVRVQFAFSCSLHPKFFQQMKFCRIFYHSCQPLQQNVTNRTVIGISQVQNVALSLSLWLLSLCLFQLWCHWLSVTHDHYYYYYPKHLSSCCECWSMILFWWESHFFFKK